MKYNPQKTLEQVFPNLVTKKPNQETKTFRHKLPPLRKNGNVFVPPPDFFKSRKSPKTPKLRGIDMSKVSLRNSTGNKKKRNVDRDLETKSEASTPEELHDFTTLLTKRLIENLDESEVGKGNYTLKKKSYCLVIQNEPQVERKPEPMSYKAKDGRVKSFESFLPGPISLGIMLSQRRRGSFKRKEIIQFEKDYKDQLYDTYIKVGDYY